MCLSTVDEKINTTSEFGYKKVKRIPTGGFQTPIMRKPLKFRKWYSAEVKGYIATEVAGDHQEYDAGFHYYISEGEAKNSCGYNDVLVKIKVKNILYTGKEYPGCHIGVSQYIMLLKILLDNTKRIVSSPRPDKKLERFADRLATSDIEKRLLVKGRKYKSGKINQRDVEKLVKGICKNDETFARWIVFIDAFARQSAVFKYSTGLHLLLLNGQLHPDKSTLKKSTHLLYSSYYEKITRQDSNILKLINSEPLSTSMEGHRDLY